jgi:hypothetical protein
MTVTEAYTALSDLIFKGFLTAELDIDGRSFIFKTINEKEFDLIKMYSGHPDEKNYQIRFNAYFLIYSLLIADNQNILMEREKNVKELYEYFLNIPEKLFSKILEDLNGLRLTAFEVTRYIEGFSYTDFSRNNWKVVRGGLPTSTDFTGICGTSNMGLNVHQESWILINRFLDEEEIFNREFCFAVMVASASNSKGARPIRNRHDTTVKTSEDRRKKLAREGYIDTKKWSPDGWAASVDTAEELVAELERQMTGVKDKHDLFMEEYMKKMREQAERKTREAEERIRQARAGREGAFIEGSQRALSPEEAKALFTKKRPLNLEVVPDEEVSPEDKDRFMKKIGTKILTGK